MQPYDIRDGDIIAMAAGVGVLPKSGRGLPQTKTQARLGRGSWLKFGFVLRVILARDFKILVDFMGDF